jgi:hypothetical protein
MTKISDNDPDGAKGATEGEARNRDTNAGLAGQLGHRDQDPRIKGADTDFPEPGGGAEHSGEPEVKKPSQGAKTDRQRLPQSKK